MLTTGRQTGWIGIDLGSRAIKIAQLGRDRDGVRLVDWLVVPMLDDSVVTPHDLGTRWRNRLATALQVADRLHGRQAAVLMPMALTECQALEIPPGEYLERRAMIASALAGAGAGGERSFDYCEIPAAASLNTAENVHVAVVDSQQTHELVESIDACGVECSAIDSLPVVLARATSLASTASSDGPVAALDWGRDGLTFVIVVAGQPLLTRSIRACGARFLTDRVRQTLDISLEDAEHLLMEHGLPADGVGDEVQEVIADLAAELLDELLDQLRRTLTYLAIHRSRLTPREFVLFGGGATLRNFPSWLTAQLHLPARYWRLPGVAENQPGRCEWPLLGTAAALSALGLES